MPLDERSDFEHRRDPAARRVELVETEVDEAVHDKTLSARHPDHPGAEPGVRREPAELVGKACRDQDAGRELGEKTAVVGDAVHLGARAGGPRTLGEGDAETSVGDVVQSAHKPRRIVLLDLAGDELTDEPAQLPV